MKVITHSPLIAAMLMLPACYRVPGVWESPGARLDRISRRIAESGYTEIRPKLSHDAITILLDEGRDPVGLFMPYPIPAQQSEELFARFRWCDFIAWDISNKLPRMLYRDDASKRSYVVPVGTPGPVCRTSDEIEKRIAQHQDGEGR
jgi:hypothetical protein